MPRPRLESFSSSGVMCRAVCTRLAAAVLLFALAACQNVPERGPAGTASGGAKVDVKKTQELAVQSYAAGDWAAAETHYVLLAREIPQDADHWFKLGNIYARTERPDLAVASYREALVRKPDLAKAWFNMGIVQLRQAANSFHKMDVHVAGDDPSRQQAADAYAAILEILDGDGDGQTANPPATTAPDVLDTPAGVTVDE